jgi:hypothetical protein
VLEKILAHPWVFTLLLTAMCVLQFCAAVRFRHERALKKRAHHERRRRTRLLPNHWLSARKRKR